MTPQLDTVVIEESLVKVQMLKGNLRRLHIEPNICHHEMRPMVTQGFKTNYLSMKVLTFVKDEKIRSFKTPNNLRQNVDTSVTTQTSS